LDAMRFFNGRWSRAGIGSIKRLAIASESNYSDQ